MRTCRFAELAQSGSHQWPRWDLDPESVVGAPAVNHCAKDPRSTEVGGHSAWLEAEVGAGCPAQGRCVGDVATRQDQEQ